jgi:hypothetical protein
MKVTKDVGMLTLKSRRWGVQFYWPIITFRESTLKLSFSTVLVASKNTWLFDWSTGLQILGFGFGFGKYKENQ